MKKIKKSLKCSVLWGGDKTGEATAARIRENRDISSQETSKEKEISTWVAMARNQADVSFLDGEPGWEPMRPQQPGRAWPDDYSNLISILRVLNRRRCLSRSID